MAADRIEMVEFRMSTGNLSEPMKKLDALIREGKIVHNGSPLVRWCLGNVVAKHDANDNVFPRKEHVDNKIDPIVAIIMALAGWVNEEEKGSVYETRSIRFL
jgi:phage terminase large subunit-like protein